MFDQVQGDWPTHSRFILCSCDEIYLDRYFPRFYKTFTEHWSLPIHAHVIDPSGKSLERLNNLKVSHTYCETHEYDWRTSAETLKFSSPKFESDTMEHMTQAMYETYCQAQRFILLGHNIREQQSVIVADVDAYALRTPADAERENLHKDMAFTTFNSRLMATFCHFHPKRKEEILTAAVLMTKMVKESKTMGVDQKVLKQVFGSLPYTELTNGEWIRHLDVKTEQDRQEHDNCLIYHEKGTRGKIKPVEVTWTDIKTQN
jgi:hypothetical protein